MNRSCHLSSSSLLEPEFGCERTAPVPCGAFRSKTTPREELPMPHSNGLHAAVEQTRVTCAVIDGGPGITIIWLKGAHGAATTEVLRKLLSVEIDNTINDLILDLTDVTSMDRSTLTTLLTANVDLNHNGRHLLARGTPSCVRRLFAQCNVAPLPAPSPRQNDGSGDVLGHDEQTGRASDPLVTGVYA